MDLRDWLIVFGLVIIAGILLDGVRRMRRARKDSLEMSIGMGGEIENTPLDDGFNPELPNGGARVAGAGDSDEQIVTTDAPMADVTNERIEPSIGVDSDIVVGFDDDEVSNVRVVAREPKDEAVSEDASQSIALDQDEIRPAAKAKPSVDKTAGTKDKKITFGDGLKPGKSGVRKANKSSGSKKNQKSSAPTPAQEVIILNVMSKAADGFKGAELKALLDACGLEHGSMSIFHRHEDTSSSPVQFSIANAVEPGFFPPEELETLTTPGICFFMSMPGPTDNMRAFDYMYETAQCVVRNLSGEMKDERRSDITPQTIEHCRQQIRDFERRQMTARC